ncbi:ABC transporter permease [Mucilaginibacter sp. UYCu711]|uniref:ABC transporter permease n=1 Tax=Mucilaginibacter sp. UYCu711 TaxID=3156339 RepID=UPI003D197451
MNLFKIAYKSLRANPLTTLLNIILIAFGVGIITILLLASDQIGQKLDNNSKDIDLVVGAKGSPLQLILSSIFYIDFPTGNIPLKDAEALERNPLVKAAVPLALGDNYNGYRIVGTDSGFVRLYALKLVAGRFWKSDFEVNIGDDVARSQHLKVGDRFFGAHGLTGNGDIHRNHAYIVCGILSPQGNVTDNLVLTNVASVWRMHETKEEHVDGKPEPYENGEREITSLLIQYRSPMSVILFPRMVNQSTSMQAASPALESAHLFSLIGIGVDTLQWFAVLIMAISAVSVFISLYNSLKERKYDLAIMRTMGASKIKLFLIIIFEGVLLTVIGAVIGLVVGHLTLELIGRYQDSTQAKLSGNVFLVRETYLIGVGFGIGLLASIIPAIQAYQSNISKILAKN